MTEKLSWAKVVNWTAKQKIAFRTALKNKYTLFGGAAGPGKSYFLRWFGVILLIRWYKKTKIKGIRGALFCEDYPSLKDRHIGKMESEFPKWLGRVKDSKIHGLGFHLEDRWGGGVLALRNLDDPQKYLSSEFAFIMVDELTQNEEDTFNRLRSRLRWPGIEDTKFIAATNPGGKGHAWVKKKWIDKEFDEGEREADQFAYVPALPTDNPHISKSYLETLKSLPEKLRKAYLEGNWDVFEGQYFTEWDRTQHVVEPFEIPETWPKFRSIDPSGRSGSTSCHWYALDPDGNVWCYREHYGADKDADEHAMEITRKSLVKKFSGQDEEDMLPEEYKYTVIDTAAMSNMGYSETIAQVYERHGVTGLIPAAKERVTGWNSVHSYLRWSEGVQPKLKIFNTCVNMIKTIPLAQHDELRPEDVSSKGGVGGTDHWDCLDDLRYFLRTMHEAKAPKEENPIEKKLREFQERTSGKSNFNYSRGSF